MKTFRVIGAIFCVFGFFFALIGILSFVFPTIQNEHFKLILNSFQESSPDTLTNTLNAIVRFCLHSGYFLLFCGISLMVAGGLISYTAYKKQQSVFSADDENEYTYPITSAVPGVPRPAYYPGGMEPANPVSGFGDASHFSVTVDPMPFDLGYNSPSQPAGPIVGRIEPSFSMDESDAEKLMHFDRQIKEQTQPDPVYTPNDPQYDDAEPAALSDDFQRLGDLDSGPLRIMEALDEDGLPKKPRIVSTMGKRKS